MSWDIFDEVYRMQEEMERAFSSFMYPSRQLGPGRTGDESEKMPVRNTFVDVQETDSTIIVTAELPGMDKEDINLRATAGKLEIKGEKKEEQTEEKENFKAYNSRYANFYRSIPLPADVDPEDVKATYKNGVLEVTLPKKAVESHTVPVD
jgi:HSP20 family protein